MRATRQHDDYGRPWGVRLWEGGPILGGIDWRDFVEKRFAIEMKIAALRSPSVIGDDESRWEE
jgi:hypothetical protein